MRGRAFLFGLLLLGASVAGAGDDKAGKEANVRGMRLYKAKDFVKAADEFRAAIAASPKLLNAHYNLACVAALSGDKKTVLVELEWLKSNGEEGADRLRKARTDPDLASVAADPQVRKILDTVAFTPKLPPLVGLKEMTATSTAQASKLNRDIFKTFSPEIEGNPSTDMSFASLWCADKPDGAIGEGFSLTFAEPTKLDTLAIGAGDLSSPKAFQRRNRILEVEATIDGTRKVSAQLPPITKDTLAGKFEPDGELPWISVALGAAPVKSIAVRIAKVKPGKLNESCITALELKRGDTKILPLLGVTAAGVASLGKAITAVQDAILGHEPSAMEKILEFPFTYEYTDPERFCAFKGGCPSKVFKDAAAAAKGGLPEYPGDRPDGELYLLPDGPGGVRINLPGGNEVVQTWHLAFRPAGWRLVKVGWDT